MEWELSKENVQPLRKGRKNVELLNRGLKAKIDSPARCELSEQRRVLLEEIDTYVGDDPLEPWIRCIDWTKEAYPSGGSQSGILPMLELCLRTFCGDAKYKSDLRYLKLWLEYADRCTHPKDIYTFLDVNEIGQAFALYYLAYAGYLESCKNLPKANEVFQLGLSRNAEPADELKAKYKSFFQRSARNAKVKQDEQEDEEPVLRSFGSNSAHQPLRTVKNTTSHPLRKTSKQNAPQQHLSNQKFSVFVDSDFDPEPKRSHHHHQDEALQPVWKNLGTQAERAKENVQHPSKWNAAKIPQVASKLTPTERPLDVYVDEAFSHTSSESRSMNMERRPSSAAALRVRFSRVQDLKTDAELLKETPLRNFSRDLR